MDDWPRQLGILVPLLSAVVAWYINERSKRRWEEYTRKEQHYTALLDSIPGFFKASDNKEHRDQFLRQVNLCWLYCPDEVINKAYGFLQSVHVQSPDGPAAGEKALGDFVAAIRRDMLIRRIVTRTGLTGADFRRFASR